MKNSTKRIMSSLMIFIMLLGLVMPVFANGATKTTAVTIHKLKYDTTLDASKKIKNVGTEKKYDQSIKPYDASEYGTVGFTLYRLDNDKVVAKVKEENGNAQAVADKIAADISGNTTNGTIKNVEVAEVKQTAGTEPISMSVTTTTNADFFLLVETTSPATITDKAQPMLIQLPMRSADGKSLLDTVHLYPKNKVDEASRELEFNKVVLKVAQDGTTDATTKFEGANFEVYKGKPGNGTKLNGTELKSDVNGTFKVTGLTVGNYYLVEIGNDKVDSLVSTEAKSTSKGYIASVDAKNDSNNKYAFRMDEDGHIYKITGWNGDTATINKGTEYNTDDQKLPLIKNTIKPSAFKKIVSKNKSIGYGDTLEYEINVNIPANFGKNSTDEKLVIKDTATEGVIINTDSFKVYDKEGNERTKAEIKVEKVKDNEVNITLDKNSIKTSDTEVSYKPIVLKYIVKLSKDFNVNGDTKITNSIDSTYTIDGNEFKQPDNPVNPEDPNNKIPDENKGGDTNIEIKTYTKKLKKVDSGIFETGAVKKPLAGAEFILGRKIGDKIEYRKIDATDKYAWTETKVDAQAIKSGDDGTFEFEGLAAKTDEGVEISYFAKEIKAPENYVLPANEDDRKHTFTFTGENAELVIENNKSVGAPMTGYEKATITVAALGTALLISVVALKKDRKKENNQ